MTKVYRLSSFFVYEEEFGALIEWELLCVSVQRSLKVDVWASRKGDSYELEYRGRFTPELSTLIETDGDLSYEVESICAESEAFVRQTFEILKKNSSQVNMTT